MLISNIDGGDCTSSRLDDRQEWRDQDQMTDEDALIVSNHALDRFMERVMKIEPSTVDEDRRQQIRRSMITPQVVRAAKVGAKSTTINGVIYRFREGYVVTVVVNDKKSRPSKKQRRGIKKEFRKRGY